jgi:hypothetical protein
MTCVGLVESNTKGINDDDTTDCDDLSIEEGRELELETLKTEPGEKNNQIHAELQNKDQRRKPNLHNRRHYV